MQLVFVETYLVDITGHSPSSHFTWQSRPNKLG